VAETTQSFSMTPYFLSAAVGDPHRVGVFLQAQARAFHETGGDRPASRLDIRSVRAEGPEMVLSRVDPGYCWVLHAASLLGMPLSVAGVAEFQQVVDLVCLWLAAWLALRVWGPVAGGLASVLYGANSSIPAITHLVTYYFWSVPMALVLAHVGLLCLRRSRVTSLWWAALVLLAAWAVWVRILWLPVFVVFLTGVGLVALPRKRALAVASSLFALVLSYALLLHRVANEGLGDMWHPRSQLWHTLYIGLGAYGDWDDIRWLDEYAYAVAGAAGISSREWKRYDEFFRGKFVGEVSSHPARYIAAIARRIGDYVDFGRVSVAGARIPARSSWLGWTFLVIAAICLARDRFLHFDEQLIGALYGLQIGAWAILVPPVMPYPVETLGLAYPLVAGVIVVSLRVTTGWFRRTDPGSARAVRG